MDAAPKAPLIIGRDFFDRARRALTLTVPPALTDLARDPPAGDEAGVKATRPAAVLVPVVDHPEPSVLLTLRTSDLPSHAGQVAFPGGKIAAAEPSPLAAALREAQEIGRAHVCT